MAKKLAIGDLDAIFGARFGNTPIEEKSEDASSGFSPLAPDKTPSEASFGSQQIRGASSEMPDQAPEAATPARRLLATSAATPCPAHPSTCGEAHKGAYAQGTQGSRTPKIDSSRPNRVGLQTSSAPRRPRTEELLQL